MKQRTSNIFASTSTPSNILASASSSTFASTSSTPTNPKNLSNNNKKTDAVMESEYNEIMARAIQELAIASLAVKYNPGVTPGKLDSVVRKFGIKEMAKKCGSKKTYNENLVKIFNDGGMDAVTKHFEEKFFKVQSKGQKKKSQNKQ
ncbi:hypothetical protein RclHR1_01110005 [Rhizophagus clarus]|uniref:Uncharacterized protein n=1 Tax=Rhizophagus clarus TaxID=94130 RepID=A0A2Z6Q3I6_9GLOM|nr:hypothetical protein RclHR1_01110005 [Rhizophagus clarus]GES74540.1 hypothetical protein GLOIN_2v1867465 [Rhizophagus clarus]